MIHRYPCRCKKCGARKTLAKHPLDYKIQKYALCPIKGCGGELRVDHYRMKKEHRKTKCVCLGYHFPHRKGGGVWCEHHPTGPTEQDYIDRYGADYA